MLSKLRLPALVCSIEEVSKGEGKSPCGGLAVGKVQAKTELIIKKDSILKQGMRHIDKEMVFS